TNRSPQDATLSISGPVTQMSGNNYYMWVETTATLSSTISDPDSNLTLHGIYYEEVQQNPTYNWTLMGNSTPSNSANSSKSVPFTPDDIGRFDFKMEGSDGYV